MRNQEKVSQPYIYVGAGYRIDYDVVGHSPQYLDHQYPFNVRITDSFGRILDDPIRRWIKTPTGNKVLAFKPVDHVKWSGNFSGSIISYHLTNQGYNNCTVSNLDSRTHVQYPTSEGNDISAWAVAKVDTLLASIDRSPYKGHFSRWDYCKPTMTTKANAAVFLAELRDIKRMFELLPRKHFKLNDWREVFRYANGLHLNYNFGWKPFIRDLNNFSIATDSFFKRLHVFLRDQMRLLKRSKRDSPVEGERSWSEPALWGWTFQLSGSWRITRGSAFSFEYQVPRIPYNQLLWRAWADSLGLHLSPKNVWAIVPWSFVVDWFVDISGFLSQFDYEYVDPWVALIQACYSYLEEVRLSLRVQVPTSYGIGPVSGQVCTLDWRRFRRGIGTPSFTWDSQTLNSDRIRLLASLVASRVV